MKRARGPKANFDPLPPSESFLDPARIQQFRKDVYAADKHARANDKKGLISTYGSSTWLTALETTEESSASSQQSDPCLSSDSDDEFVVKSLGENTRDRHHACNPDDFYARHVTVSATMAADIEKRTSRQAACHDWFAERRMRVTASAAKSIFKRRSKDFTRLVREHLYGTFHGTAATRYGKRNESKALECLQKHIPGLSVQPSGLVIHPSESWLAASP